MPRQLVLLRTLVGLLSFSSTGFGSSTSPLSLAVRELGRAEEELDKALRHGRVPDNLQKIYFLRGIVRQEAGPLETFFSLLGSKPFPEDLKAFVTPRSAAHLASVQSSMEQRARANLTVIGFFDSCTKWIDGLRIETSRAIPLGSSHLVQVLCPQSYHWMEVQFPPGTLTVSVHRLQFVSQERIAVEPPTPASEKRPASLEAGLGLQSLSTLQGNGPLAPPSDFFPGPELSLGTGASEGLIAVGQAQLENSTVGSDTPRPSLLWLRAQGRRRLFQLSFAEFSGGISALTFANNTGLQGFYPGIGAAARATVLRINPAWRCTFSLSAELVATPTDSYTMFGLSFAIHYKAVENRPNTSSEG